MSGVDEVVDITITQETLGIKRTGFGVPIIIGSNLNTVGRIAFFTTLEGVRDAVIGGVNSVEYKMASAVFSQNPRVERLAIGAMEATKEAVFTGTMTQGNIVSNVNGEEVITAFDTDLATTVGNVASDITTAAIDGVATAVASGGDTVTITPTVGKTVSFVVTFTGLGVTDTVIATLGSTLEVGSDIDADYEAIKLVNNSWYWVLIISRVQADQISIANKVEADTKHFVTATSESNVIDQADGVDTTSIAYLFKASAYKRSTLFYIGDNTIEMVDAGYVGNLAPRDPGSYTGMFKTLISINDDELTPTQSLNARDKNCNTYEEIGSKNIVREGITPSGEFTDVIVFIDWLTSRMGEDVFAVLVASPKIPYTDSGIQVIGNNMEPSLSLGQKRGGISEEAFDDDGIQIGGYVIQLPRKQDTDPTDRANRILRDMEFTAWIAGAIHNVKINGTITV